MIQNPNVFVRNFDEFPQGIKREGIIFSGPLSAAQTLSYEKVQQRYLYLRIDVKVAGTGYVETYRTSFNDKFPVLRNLLTKEETDRTLFKEIGTYHLYAELYSADTFKLYFGVGDGKSEIEASLAFCNELPDITGCKDSIDTITRNQYTVAQDINSGCGCIIRDNTIYDNTIKDIVFDRSKRWLVMQSNSNADAKAFLFLYADNGIKLYPKYYNEQGDAIATTGNYAATFKKGITYLFYDLNSVSDFADGVSLQLAPNNPEKFFTALKYVCQTNDISDFVTPIVIPSNNGKYILEKTIAIISCWNRHSVHHSASSGLLKLRNGDETVIVDLNDLLGIKAGSQAETHLIPYDINKKNNSYGNIGLIIRESGTAGRYWFCDVTDINSVLTASNWKQVNFWEKSGTGRKILTKTSGLDDKYRLDTTLPDTFYSKENISGSLIQYQGVPNMRTLGPIAISKKMAVCAQYDTDGYRCNVWATTDGGQNWVSQYDFRTLYSRISDKSLIPNINTSSFASYNGGLALKKVTFNLPSNDNKEPEHIISLAEIAFSAISSETECVVTSSSHGLSTGDIVCFTGNSTSEWNQLTNNAISEDNMGDNLYFVEKRNNDSFYLRYYNGSYDSILPCRHIHSVTEVQDGFLIATGETYPEGWIMFLQQRAKDEAAVVDVMTKQYPIFRLNSSEKGIQRACGLLLSKEKDPDIIFFSDDSYVLQNELLSIEGRTSGLPSISSNGIWRGKLSKIDDMSAFERICDIPEPMIWIYRFGNLVLGYAQLGGFVVSQDCGETWEYLQINDYDVSMFNGICNGYICFGKGYTLKKRL